MEPSDRPTSIRWYVLGVTTLASFLLYLDRICVGFVAKSITVEFNATQYDGWFIGAFFWSYALFQVPSGMLSDRFGIRRMLVVYILSWSALTAALGFAYSFWLLIVFRLLCGLAQAGAYPSAARAIRDWMPFAQRGTASSIVGLGGRLGGALAPALTAPLMIYFALQAAGPEIRPDEVLQSAAGPSGDELLTELSSLDVLAPPKSASEYRPEVQKVLQRASANPSLTAVEHARLNRQFAELLYPGRVKKLEARGWRPVMVLYGGVGIAVALAFWWVFRENPADHPWCNAAEEDLILRGTTPAPPTVKPAFPWGVVLTDRRMWGNCLSQFGTNVGWVFLVATLPRYLEDVHHVPVVQRGMLSSLPLFAALPALLIGGPWTDRFTQRFGLKWGRRVPIVVTRIGAACGYSLCILVLFGIFGPLSATLAVGVAVGAMCLVSIGTDLGVPATWAFAQDVGGRHTAAILGWGNMWGNLGAAAAPPLYSWVLGRTPTIDTWIAVFAIAAAGFLVAAMGAFWMDASHPVDVE